MLFDIYYQLGSLALPLFFLSAIAAMLIVERFVLLLWFCTKSSWQQSADQLLSRTDKMTLQAREDAIKVWLVDTRKHLQGNMRLLQLIAVIAPLLGLLGTILGLIQAFGELSQSDGPLEVNLLAEGLGLAMYTTAVGLVLALPCIISSHLLGYWIDHLVHRMQGRFQIALLIDQGLQPEEPTESHQAIA